MGSEKLRESAAVQKTGLDCIPGEEVSPSGRAVDAPRNKTGIDKRWSIYG